VKVWELFIGDFRKEGLVHAKTRGEAYAAFFPTISRDLEARGRRLAAKTRVEVRQVAFHEPHGPVEPGTDKQGRLVSQETASVARRGVSE